MRKSLSPCSRQITVLAPHHSKFFLRAGCSSCHPTNSAKALKADTSDKHTRLYYMQIIPCRVHRKQECPNDEEITPCLHDITGCTTWPVGVVLRRPTNQIRHEYNSLFVQFVKPVVQPAASAKHSCSQVYNRSYNRLHGLNTHAARCTTGRTTGCIDQTLMQPGVQPVV